MIARLLRTWQLYWYDRKAAGMFMEIHAELRARYPDKTPLDLLDLTCDVYKIKVTDARLLYTLKHGSVRNAPTKVTKPVRVD